MAFGEDLEGVLLRGDHSAADRLRGRGEHAGFGRASRSVTCRLRTSGTTAHGDFVAAQPEQQLFVLASEIRLREVARPSIV